MSDDLVDRADYCQEHGIFDAAEAGKSVSYGELAAEIRSLREQVAKDRAGIVAMVRREATRAADAANHSAEYDLDRIARMIEAQQDKTT